MCDVCYGEAAAYQGHIRDILYQDKYLGTELMHRYVLNNKLGNQRKKVRSPHADVQIFKFCFKSLPVYWQCDSQLLIHIKISLS